MKNKKKSVRPRPEPEGDNFYNLGEINDFYVKLYYLLNMEGKKNRIRRKMNGKWEKM